MYCKPVKRLENMSDMMKFWNLSDASGSRIKNKFKTNNWSRWKINQKRVAIVNFGVNERSSNSYENMEAAFENVCLVS